MKTIKIVSIVGIVIALGFSVVAIAANTQQEMKQNPEMGWFGFMAENMPVSEMVMEHLKERLTLTEEQEAQLLPILEESMKKRVEMFQKYGGQVRQNVQTIKTEHETMWQETEKQLAEILTEEQMQELRKMHDERVGMRQGFAQKMFQRRGQFQQVFKELNLSKEQMKELFSIVIKYRENRGDVMESFQEIRTNFVNMLLTEEFDEEKVRQTYQESAAKMEEFVVTGAKMAAEMKAVLTPEQLEILQEKGTELLAQLQEHGHSRHAMFGRWFHHHAE
jgi:Spy/CpxP family protein refolding chaperone